MANQWIKIGDISSTGVYLGLPTKGDGLRIDRDVTLEHYIHSIHAQDAVLHKYDANGNLDLNLKPKDGVDELIYAFFGQVSTVDNGDGTYTHTFTAKEEDIPELTIIKNIGTLQEKYTGVKVVKLSITSPANGEVELSVDVIGLNGEKTTGEAEGSYDGSKSFRVLNGTATWGGSTYAIGNVEVELERDAGTDGFTLSGDTGRTLIPEGNFFAKAKLDVLADSTQFIDDFLAGTAKPLVLTLQTPDGETIEIHLPNAIITKRGKESQVDKQLIIEEVELTGIDDGTNGSAYIVLKNDVAAYPRT